ncbi:NAD kinase [Bacillus horti]|uniref:NAD kinase n=1 Tax=Caldalkalibacillus horti TaxID=77523 RepID=A0ABT9W501_9BACI|nr:NAD kinase [Bacillus horti]MDQ0168139.1 NAD+ kinase [Bacillus horti]
MKFAVISRGDELSNQLKNEMDQRLAQVNLTQDEHNPDIVITVGGDGTLLEAFHRYVHRLEQTSFVGIHTGHLGFYADWQPHEIDMLIRLIGASAGEQKDGSCLSGQSVYYPLLEVIIHHTDEKEERFLALNECTVKTSEGSLVMDIEVNDEHFETFRGDGLCISTPSGSTAYNKSLGGAIVHPALPAIQLAEMASINNRVYRTIGSPLIFPEHHRCTLKPINERSYQITLDHLSFLEQNVDKIVFRVAPEKVCFARYQRFPFWKRVKESFISENRG